MAAAWLRRTSSKLSSSRYPFATSGGTRGAPKIKLVGNAWMLKFWASAGNSSASRMNTRRGAKRRLPPPVRLLPAAKAAPGAAGSELMDPALLCITSWITGTWRSHHGQPWREKTMTTCSWPDLMDLVIEDTKRCCQPSVAAAPGATEGSARRTKSPSSSSKSSPLWGMKAASSPPLGGSAPPTPTLESTLERVRKTHGADK
mmetsp:Transcript_104296/g.232943  ORF Transcript_104296/g.232943 Transcript_104296/m.232943 type:complete len:202 (-) Transcript_104296:594-1199(-)